MRVGVLCGFKGMFLLVLHKNREGKTRGFFASRAVLVLGFTISLHPCVFNCRDGEEPGREGSAGSISYANIMLAPFLIFAVFTRKCKQLLT